MNHLEIRGRMSIALVFAFASCSAFGATRTVGPSGTYPKPCAAIAAASDGDTIEIDAAGAYAGDVCQITKNGLTLRGVNGLAKIDAAGQNSGGKATWVISGNDTTVENVEFSGAAVTDANGAGIRQEGANLTVRGCYFHDNQDGILAGDSSSSQILIEHTEFSHNGAGDGFSHNLYINHVAKFTFQYNYSHDAVVGHLLKSRAAETYVLYNRLTGETGGTESYEIDVPNGGKTFVIGNLVEQPSSTGNPSMLAYQEEGTNAANPSDALFVVNNTFVNDKGSGTFVSVGGGVMTHAVLTNNVFAGGGTPCSQPGAVLTKNYTGTDAHFVDAAHYDYRLMTGSACIDAGADPGSGSGFSLLPTRQYVHPASSEPRSVVSVIDIGAYEFGVLEDAGVPGEGGASSGGAAGAPGEGGASSGGALAAGGASSGGAPGALGAGGASSGGTAGTSSAGAGTGGATSTGSGGADTDGGVAKAHSGDTSGCGCRVTSRVPAPPKAWAPLLAALMTLLRRRRRAR